MSESLAKWEILNLIMSALEDVETLEARLMDEARGMEISVMQLMHSDGSYAMMPIVLAKSNLLPALYAVKKDIEEEEEVRKIVDWISKHATQHIDTQGES